MTTILILPGATSQSVYFKAIDNTTGLSATTLTSATAGLAISYQNTQTGTVTAISLSDLAATNSAWSSGGIKHIAGGVYRLCVPDASVPATEGAQTVISGTATAFQILGCTLVGKPAEVVSGSLVAASVTGAVGSVTGAVGSVTGAVGSVTGAVGGSVPDSAGTTTLLSRITALLQTKAEADAATSGLSGAIAALPTVSSIWAGITAAASRTIADHVLRRSWASAAGSADGDALSFRSLLGAVAKLVNRVGISGATLTVYQDDDTTALGEQTLTSDAAAEPITGANTV